MATNAYTYDNAGNLVKEVSADGTTSYTYDAEGRLVKGEKSDGSSSSYVYDAMGARTRNVQVRENENTGAANADLADGSHGIDYMAFLKTIWNICNFVTAMKNRTVYSTGSAAFTFAVYQIAAMQISTTKAAM